MMHRTISRGGAALLLLAVLGCRDEGPAGPAAAKPALDVNAAVALDWTVYDHLTPPPSPEWGEAFALPTGELYVVGFGRKLAVQKDGEFRPIPFSKDWRLNDVWASSPTQVVVVGTTGLYGRAGYSNGTSFVEMPVPYQLAPFQAVWGFAANDMYAVAGRHVLHSTGGAWSIVFSAPSGTSFTGLWGSGPSDIFAVGWNGVIYHKDAIGWQQQASGTTKKLDAVWGFSPTDVHAVGVDGVALHYDGTSWSPAGTLAATMQGLWGSAPDDVWAVGKTGWTAHFDGTSWTSIKTSAKGDLWGVAGRSATDVHAVGANYLLYDGVSWKPFSTPPTVNGVWGFHNSLVFAVTSEGTILRFDGASWTTMPSPAVGALHDIWGASANDLYAVGVNGTILHYNGNAWSKMNSGIMFQDLYAVWGYRGTVFAVGENGLAVRYDGSTWQLTAPTGTSQTLMDVHGTSAQRVFAVAGGRVLSFDGTSWSSTSPATTCCVSLHSVWASSGTVFAAGSPGAVFVRGPGGWQQTTLPGSPTMQGLWGSGPGDVFAVGSNTTIVHWDGAAWTPVAPPANLTSSFSSVWMWGSSPTEIFVGGNSRTLIRGHR